MRRTRLRFSPRLVAHLLGGLCCLAGVGSARGSAAGELDVRAGGGVRSYETGVQPGETLICLGARFVAAGSDSVWLAGRRLTRGRDYTLDGGQGCLLLSASVFDSLAGPARLLVRYRALPLGLERVYVRRDLEAGRGSGLAGGALPAAPGPAPAPADSAGLRRFPVDARRGGPDNLDRPDLQVAGSKTIRFDLGNNRDLALHQTLDLRVEGTLSRDVRLRALLSDRNLPFQPEGNTAELEELDKVLIEVEGPKARVGLGDQDLAVDSGTLLRFSRRLQGLMAQAGTVANGATVTAAAQRGEFQTQEFLGTEGKQGPYALTDRLGGRGVVIVAGSERVWLDGVELKRGLDADYTIDYGRAELTFSPRHGITAQTRVAVDYQYSAFGYRRNLFRAAGHATLGDGALQLGTNLVRESDDAGRPVSGTLTAEEKAQLAAAGDNPVSTGSGIRLVGEGLGRYRQAFDASASRTYYRFVGSGQGNYEIRFVRLGERLGDYADSLAAAGDTVFVYRGANGGAWAPAGGLTQPVALEVGQFTARWAPGAALSAAGELAVSRQDRNTLSALDDGDNNGSAARASLALAPQRVDVGGTSLGTLELGATFRRLGRGFAAPGRLDDVFTYDRDWNLPRRGDAQAESRTEVQTAWRPRPEWRVGGEGGDIAGGNATARRGVLRLERTGATFLKGELVRGRSRVDSTVYAGRLERETLRTGTRLSIFQPGAWGEREERLDPALGQGSRYLSGGGDLRVLPLRALEISAGVDGRDDDARAPGDTPWQTVSRAVTRRVGLNVGGSARFQAAGAWQSRHVSRPGAGPTRTDLATLDLTQRSPRSSTVTDIHYRLATTGVETRSRTLRFVGAGLGNYDAFGNPFPGGGYEVEEGALGAEELTADLDLSLRFELNPFRGQADSLSSLGGWARRNLAWRADGRLQELSRLSLGRPGVLFDPKSYQNPASTIRGRQQLHQQIEIFPLSRRLTLRLLQDLDDIANYQYTNFREDRREALFGGGLRSTPWPALTLEFEERHGTRAQAVTAGTAGVERTARVGETHGSLVWRATGATRLNLDMTWRRESDRAAGGRGSSLDLNPRLSWLPTTKSRLDLVAHWVAAERSGGYTGIGGFSSVFLQDRVEIGLDGDLRVGDSLTFGAGLTGRRYEGSRTVVDGRTEVRAYF